MRFPYVAQQVSQPVGIDLSIAPTGTARGVGGTSITYRYADLQLRLSDGVETCEWPAILRFLDLPMAHGLLGQTGFFQFFDVAFLGASKEVTIVPNATFTGVHQCP